MEALLGLVGLGVCIALCFWGWPKLFTINIHKHYHYDKKDDVEKEEKKDK